MPTFLNCFLFLFIQSDFARPCSRLHKSLTLGHMQTPSSHISGAVLEIAVLMPMHASASTRTRKRERER